MPTFLTISRYGRRPAWELEMPFSEQVERRQAMTEPRVLSRRAFLGACAAAAAGTALTACAPPQPAPQIVRETVVVEKEKQVTVDAARAKWLTGRVDPSLSQTLRIMSWEDEGEMRKFLLAINRFLQTFYPKVKPEIEWGVPWGEYWTKLPTLLAAGNPPDMAWQHCSRGQLFPAKGWSVCLDDYIEAYPPDGWPDDWWEASVNSLSYKGRVYALPYDWCPIGLYVNRDIMDPITPYPVRDDWTFEDLEEMALAATKGQGIEKVFGASVDVGSDTHWRITRTFGGNLFSADMTKSTMDSPESFDAAQFLWDLRWKHKVSPTPADFEAMGLGDEVAFASARVGMHQALNDLMFRLGELIGGLFPWGVYPYPRGKGGRFAFQGNSGWFIPTNSTQPDLSYELMRYCLSSPDVLPTTAVMGGAFVGRKSFAKWGLPTGELAEMIPNFYHAMVEMALENVEPFPWWPGYHEWEAIYLKHMDPVFTEGKPGVKEALAALQRDTQEFLDKGWWWDA
jgi:ABC-type glycerol-3-phosphate transport system substrate-binding protein